MEKLDNIPDSTIEQQIENGILFIPDISGFSKFVRSTDLMTGKLILQQLLSAIIQKNVLHMKISEIEGDAVLFYRFGPAPTFSDLSIQYRLMSGEFERRRRQLELDYAMDIDLSLKVIAHYGPLVELQVGPFNKLYGEVVVEAHHLLKNSISSSNYLLLTNQLLTAADSVPCDNEHHVMKSHLRCDPSCHNDLPAFSYLEPTCQRLA